MAIKLSTGLRNHLCVTGSLRGALNGLLLNLYSGTIPSSADAEESTDSTLLCTISSEGSGSGLNFETTALTGVLVKETSETWQGTVLANGTATYYRLVSSGDTGASSTTAIRVQGSVGTINADMLISSPSLVEAAVQRISFYSLTFPAQ